MSARRSQANLRVTDCTPLTKVFVQAFENGMAARDLGVGFGRAVRDENGTLRIGSGPGEWLLLAPPGSTPEVVERVEAVQAEEPVSVVDVTHGRALVRISGTKTVGLLPKICGIDMSDSITPDGAAFRSSVAKVITDIVRDDGEGARSYLLHCERSFGQYLFDALLDAGEEFGIEIEGFASNNSRSPE
jgi:heterotetrameric sarcosine oxidase gamma subunit